MTNQEKTMKVMIDNIIHPLREENQKLKHRVSSLKEDAQESREVVKLYKSLIKDGAIYVNTSSQDCDGVCSYYSYKFTDIDEYFQAKRHYEEQDFEGPASWNVVSIENALSEDEEGTYGHGWDIH